MTIKDGRTIQINPLDGCTSEQVSATYGTFIRRVTGTVETCSSQASEYAFAAYVESRCIEFPFLSPLIGRNLAVDGCSQIKADSWWSDWKISRAESQATKQLETTYGEQPSEASCTILKGIYQQKYDNLK